MLEQEQNTHSVKPMDHYQKSLKPVKVIPLALLILGLGVMSPLTAHADQQEKRLCSELKFQSLGIQWHVKTTRKWNVFYCQKQLWTQRDL